MSLANEGVEAAILYGYVVDRDMPNYLSRGDLIFNVKNKSDLSISAKPFMKCYIEYSTNESSADKKMAANCNVSGNYGAFTAAASMSMESNSSSNTKTVRLDAICRAEKYQVIAKGQFRTFPAKFITEDFKEAVRGLSYEDFEERVGVFYASSLHLGGCIKKTYVMEATEKDDESSVTAELEASYGKGCFGVTGKAGSSSSCRSSNKSAKMRTEWSAQGGKTEVWLGQDFSKVENDANEIAKEWAATIDDTNLYPSKYQLRPIWELVKAVDQKKGDGFQKYLEAKWAKDASSFRPTQFLKTEELISDHKNKNWMIKRCSDHGDWCQSQAAEAQSWIDDFWSGFDAKRNGNWKNAAESGRHEMNELISMLKNGTKSTAAFKDDIHQRIQNRDANSKHWWGVNGHDSVESNRVEATHRDVLKEIQRQL